MDIITPSYGTVFWTTIAFFILLILLAKFAWKPILEAIREREHSIDEALNKAELAKKEMERLTSQNENLLKEAIAQREAMMKDARDAREKMLADAKADAHTQGAAMVERARAEIEQMKSQAMADVKSQVAQLSVDMAERILKQQLAEPGQQELLVDRLLNDVKIG